MAEWVVKQWGRIHRNNDATIKSYIEKVGWACINVPIKGIATYSKILAASNPEKFAIYDSRVAVSLNAIQILAKVKTGGRAFPYIPGRNKIIGNWSGKPRTGFSCHPDFHPARLASQAGWTQVPRATAYQNYLELIEQLALDLKQPLYTLEMAFFADAECLVRRTIGDDKFKIWTGKHSKNCAQSASHSPPQTD